jgi:hypothetical protein
MQEGAPEDSAAKGRKRGGSYSGRLLLRMPESLHAELAKASEQAGVSLNGYINDALAAAVGRRRSSDGEAPAAKDAPPRRRLLERLLLVNLAVMLAVGALVVVLLVQTLR